MEEIIFYVIIFIIIIIIIKWISSSELKKQKRKIKAILEKLECIEVDADTVIVDGTSYNQNVPVDVYGTELNPNDSTFITGATASPSSIRRRYHKQENITKFKSTLYIPIIYQNQEYKFDTNLPINQTTLRMKMYMQKNIPVYVKEFNSSGKTTGVEFIVDFRFLNVNGISLVNTNYYKVN